MQLTKAAGTDEAAVTAHTYDWLGRVKTSALGEASTKTYNTLGWVLSEQDADGIQTLRTYDAAGRVLAESVGGKTTTSIYEVGRLKAQTNPQGRTTSYTYDDFGRVVLETHLQGAAEIKSIETAYDALSRAVATTQTAGPARTVAATSRLTYAAGSTKHSSMTTSYGGASTTVTYDSSDRETTRTTTFAGGASARSTTSRDGEDRATAWSTDGEASSASYDASGKLTGQAGLGWAGSPSGASYTYDSDTGRKVAETLSLLGSAADYSRSYLYTEAGRLAKVTSGGAVWDYGFDERGNIASATTWDGSAATFAYDTGAALPDRLKTSVIGGITTEYRFDALGRREFRGPAALPTQVSYTWDDDSRLVAYRDLGTADVEASFTYDAAGQRTSSTIRRGTTTVASTYVYDGITLLSVAATETIVGQSPVSCAITYLYDETARPYAATYAEAGGAPQLIHLTTNDRGDVLQALTEGGTSFATYRYDAWGNAAGSTATGTTAQNRFARLQPLRYAGYCYDGGTGLYYLSARYYDPATYQFLSKDPVKDDGEESAYQYCGGDPVGSVDPSGELKIKRDLSYYIHDWGGAWRYLFGAGFSKRLTDKRTARIGFRGFYVEFGVPKWARDRYIEFRVTVYYRPLLLWKQHGIYEKHRDSRGQTYFKRIEFFSARKPTKSHIYDYKYVFKWPWGSTTRYSFSRVARNWGY